MERRLEETSAAKTLMTVQGSPSFGGLKNVAAVWPGDMGGVLNTRELLDIANLLQCARAVRSYAGGAGGQEKTAIDGLFRSLQSNRYLEDKIRGAILGEEEIADGASSELSDIRRKIRAANARVRDALRKSSHLRGMPRPCRSPSSPSGASAMWCP